MFYVGDTLWLKEKEEWRHVPNAKDFIGAIKYWGGTMMWYKNCFLHSPQDPETGEWLPAIIYPDGGKDWFDHGRVQSFPDHKTGELMPAIIWSSGKKWWYDKGIRIPNPNEEG